MRTLSLCLPFLFDRMATMNFRVPSLLLSLLLISATAEGAVDRDALLRMVDAQSRSAKIEQELKEWKDMGNDPYAKAQKKELTKQLHAVKRDDEARKRLVIACLDKVRQTGDINAGIKGGVTLLMAVANTGADDATEAVLRENPDLTRGDDQGHTALWYEMRGMGHTLNNRLMQQWRAAMAAGQAEEVRYLLECGLSPATPTENGNPPLGEAIDRGLDEIFTELMKHDTTVTYPMADGRTLMGVAVERGNARAISFLLTFGADADEHLSTGETPLRYLLRCGSPEAVVAFVKGAELGNRAEGDTRVCCVAARLSTAATVQALLAAVDAPHEEDAYGNTPLLEAARRGDLAVYDAVLASRPPRWQNSRGETPLMHAALSGSEAMLRRVLETMPPELRDKADADGRRATDYAALTPNPEPLRRLLAQPAE